MPARKPRPGRSRGGPPARRPMVVKPRRQLRRRGQFACRQCQAVRPLAELRKCCGTCPTCCACNRPPAGDHPAVG